MAHQVEDDLRSNSSLSDGDDNDWEDAEPDEEDDLQVVSFFDNEVFKNARAMLDYSRERYNFDFMSIQKQHSQFRPYVPCAKSMIFLFRSGIHIDRTTDKI